MPIVRHVLSQWHSISMVCLILVERVVVDLNHVDELLQQDTSAPTFLEAPAGEGDAQSGLFGLSGFSGGASDSGQPDKRDRPDRPNQPAFVGRAYWKINQPPSLER
jgi:hypothetical protein